jgi:hypothetical protein
MSDSPYNTPSQAGCWFYTGHNFGREWRTPVRAPISFKLEPVTEPAARYWSERICRACGYRERTAHGFTP